MLWNAINQIGTQVGASSEHILFLTEKEFLECNEITGTINRLSYQFHWTNPGVESFDEWLSTFRSKPRKNIKVERKKAQNSVDSIYCLRGNQLTDIHIQKIWEFYQNTINRKWGNESEQERKSLKELEMEAEHNK